jgi:multiple antibiotic resistance protein
MRYSTLVSRVLGKGGITILTRISGLLLAAIAVQLVADSVMGFVAG